MATRDWVAVDGDISHGDVGGNYGGAASPGSGDVYRYGTLPPIAAPDSDTGSPRTFGGINIADNSDSLWAAESNDAFNQISLEGNLIINIDLGGELSVVSINGDANTTAGSGQTIKILNQASGKTCTPKGKTVLSVLGGSGTVAYGSLLDSSVRESQEIHEDFTGTITADTVAIIAEWSSQAATLSADAISKLAFTNSGTLSFQGPNGEVVWRGTTSATSAAGANWSEGNVPATNESIYIDSRIKVGGATLASLNQLPLTWASVQTLGTVNFTDGGGKDYSWTGTTVTAWEGDYWTVGSITVKDCLAFPDSLVSITVTNFTQTVTATAAYITLSGGNGQLTVDDDHTPSTLTIGTDFTGTLVNNRTNPTTDGIQNLNGSTLSATAIANLSPSASAFTNYFTYDLPSYQSASAVIDTTGTHLDLTVDIANPPLLPATGIIGFYVSGPGAGSTNVVSGVRTSNTTIRLTLDPPIFQGAVVTINYSEGNVKDSADLELEVFADQAVTNNSTVQASSVKKKTTGYVEGFTETF